MKHFFKKIIVAILELQAKAILKKYNPTIIAITGSVGKTSTKDAIYTVLSTHFKYVRKSLKSFNSEIGVPLTILGVNNAWNNPFKWIQNFFHGFELIFWKSDFPEVLILEVGADHPGDIQRIALWIRPHISVVTKVSEVPVHIEFFPSRQALLEEKSKLAKYTRKDGILVLSEDDEDVRKMGVNVPQKVFTFGQRFSAKVTATNEKMEYEDGIPVGMSCKLNYDNESVTVFLRGALGIQHIFPALAAATVGISCGMTLAQVARALEKHAPSRGRMNIHHGINDSILIDDSYNASPDAVREALRVLGRLECSGTKYAVLGDMMELGKYSAEEHKKIGEFAKTMADSVITVGQRMKNIGEGIISFNSSHEAGDFLRGRVRKGDIVLVKGSQSLRMERVSKVLLAEPEKARDLLVRQEPEWLAKE